jgi:hypothetical protein
MDKTKAIIFSANQMGANDHMSYCFAPQTKAIFYLANQFLKQKRFFSFQLIILTSFVIPIWNHAASGHLFRV